MTIEELCGIIIADLMSFDWLVGSIVIPFLLGLIILAIKWRRT